LEKKQRQAELDADVRATYKYKDLTISSSKNGGEKSSPKGMQYGRFLVSWDLLHFLEHEGKSVDLYQVEGVRDVTLRIPGDLDGLFGMTVNIVIASVITFALHSAVSFLPF